MNLLLFLVSAVQVVFQVILIRMVCIVFMVVPFQLHKGVKMANRDLTVIASGGDGDGFAIGMGHTIHSIRRNIDITYIVMDNQITD